MWEILCIFFIVLFYYYPYFIQQSFDVVWHAIYFVSFNVWIWKRITIYNGEMVKILHCNTYIWYILWHKCHQCCTSWLRFPWQVTFILFTVGNQVWHQGSTDGLPLIVIFTANIIHFLAVGLAFGLAIYVNCHIFY